ncbi:MAG: hypothetical protein ACI9G9_001622 [Psychromonas sp.]
MAIKLIEDENILSKDQLMIKSVFYILFCLTLVTAGACKKRKARDKSAEIAQQNALAENISNDIQYMTDEAVSGAQSFEAFYGECVTLTYDTSDVSDTITIDYGTAGCLCQDGKRRKGKVIITFEGSYFFVGNLITTVTQNYSVNGNLVEFHKTSKRITQSETKIQIESSITFLDNGTISWNSDKSRTQIAGSNTSFILADDEFRVIGSANGTTLDGDDFDITIKTPLTVQLGCRWIKSGKLTLTSTAFTKEAEVDYGSGQCDNKAQVTYAGKTTDLNL